MLINSGNPGFSRWDGSAHWDSVLSDKDAGWAGQDVLNWKGHPDRGVTHSRDKAGKGTKDSVN